MDRALLDYWKPTTQALDPWLELEVADLDRLYQDRAGRPSRKLAADLYRAADPTSIKVLLRGSRGSGKSTELRKIAHDLRQDFLPILLDAGLGLPRGTGTLPLVILVGVAGLAKLREWSRPDPQEETGSSLIQRLQAGLQQAVDGFATGAVKVGDLVSAVGAVLVAQPDDETRAAGVVASTSGKALSSVGQAVGGLRRERPTPALHSLGHQELAALVPPDRMDDADAVVAAVNEILAGIAEAAGRPPLLLVEGLDKRDRLEDVFQVIEQPELLDALATPMILTGPVSLRHSLRASWMPGRLRQEILPNVPVVRGGPGRAVTQDSQGLGFMTGVYGRRIQACEQCPPDLVQPAALQRLARASSGVVREFLLLLGLAIDAAIDAGRRELTDHDVSEAIRRRRIELQYALDDQRLQILAQVLSRGTRPEGQVAEELLYNNFIACYGNGKLLFRPHEALVDYVRMVHPDLLSGEE